MTYYTTNVRPTVDHYTWTYDEVGNRTTEVYNTATTNYNYDSAGATSQLASLSGATTRTMTYDANGNTLQDHWYGGAGTWNQYGYSTRHQMASLNYYNPTFQFTTETYIDDGLERRWQKANHNGTWVQNYYDLQGRLIEEYQNNGVTVNGCAAYDVVDHVYFGPGATEVARAIGRFQSNGTTGCPASSYTLLEQDVHYVHNDYRNTPFAIEDKDGLAWEGETTPFGITLHQGLPGPDGKIGTSDDTAALISNNIGLQGQFVDPEFSNLADLDPDEHIPQLYRSVIPNANALLSAGITAYDYYLGTRNPTLITQINTHNQHIPGAGPGAGPTQPNDNPVYTSAIGTSFISMASQYTSGNGAPHGIQSVVALGIACGLGSQSMNPMERMFGLGSACPPIGNYGAAGDGFWATIGDFFAGVGKAIAGFFEGLAGDVKDFFKSIANGTYDGQKAAAPKQGSGAHVIISNPNRPSPQSVMGRDNTTGEFYMPGQGGWNCPGDGNDVMGGEGFGFLQPDPGRGDFGDPSGQAGLNVPGFCGSDPWADPVGMNGPGLPSFDPHI